jgi:hypothetical protein
MQTDQVTVLEQQKREQDAAIEAAKYRNSHAQEIQITQQAWTPELVKTMGFGFLVFATIVLVLMTWSMRRVRSHVAVLRAFGLLLIITAAVFLIVVGYGERQISPVLGLLGTIAGYLLGRTADHTESESEAHHDVSGVMPTTREPRSHETSKENSHVQG